MFALIASQTLYFKTDETSRHHFEQAGSQPFVYTSRSRPVTLSYWSAPGEAMESPPQALQWARLALDAALRQSLRTASPSAKRASSRSTSFQTRPSTRPVASTSSSAR